MGSWVSNFTKRKTETAYALFKGGCGGSYADAVLILSSVMSGIASAIWPGKKMDRKRFVEALVTYCKITPHPSHISLPVLVDMLEAMGSVGATEDASLLKKTFIAFNDGRILTGADVDRNECEVLSTCPRIPLKLVREASYANVLYTEVRSGFVHEYQTGERADSHPMTSTESGISYNNWIDPRIRRIVFHFPWLADSVNSVASSVDVISDKLPLKPPEKWWVEG
jgi:hypothetical protein